MEAEQRCSENERANSEDTSLILFYCCLISISRNRIILNLCDLAAHNLKMATVNYSEWGFFSVTFITNPGKAGFRGFYFYFPLAKADIFVLQLSPPWRCVVECSEGWREQT